ncbi:MAG: PEP-CTERM sorting domain-containing protein [Limisphaerales bacterium]
MKALILITLLTLTATCFTDPILAQGAMAISNLGHAWTQPGIGDIHGLFPGGTPYGVDTAHFTTGAGNFSVNAITLEFENDSGYPAGTSAPQSVSLQLLQETGGTNLLLGSFGNPVVNPTPTPWPRSANHNAYTTYYDFPSLAPMYLSPFSRYSLIVSMPATSVVAAALLFTRVSYTSSVGWMMYPTTSGDPAAAGEYLVMAVEATSVPEPGSIVILLAGLVILGAYRHCLSVLSRPDHPPMREIVNRIPQMRPARQSGPSAAGAATPKLSTVGATGEFLRPTAPPMNNFG